MCEFCAKHGAGRTWYLQLRNYSRDRIRNDARFRDLVNWLASETGKGTGLDTLRRLAPIPGLGLLARWVATKRLKQIHFGQVLALEDVKRVFDLVDAIHLYPCVCRRELSGAEEGSYCFVLGSFLREFLEDIPTYRGGGRELSPEEAYALAESFEKDGLLHTIWTLDTPFVVGICSCKPGACLAMELTTGLNTKCMFRGESLFAIDSDRCVGCGLCLETCYFDAIETDGSGHWRIRPDVCYGCGLCRAVCPAGAVSMSARSGDLALPQAF